MSLREQQPSERIELWFQDEARLGLKPVVRRIWAPVGERPLAPSRTRYEWTYVYAAVHPSTGRVSWLILPSVSVEAMNVFLLEFALELPDGVIAVLVLDGAGWHTSGRLVVPANVRLAFLPPYSPELNPAERLWPPVREGIANESFAGIELLEDRLCDRCLQVSARPELVSALTSYHWLPAVA